MGQVVECSVAHRNRPALYSVKGLCSIYHIAYSQLIYCFRSNPVLSVSRIDLLLTSVSWRYAGGSSLHGHLPRRSAALIYVCVCVAQPRARFMLQLRHFTWMTENTLQIYRVRPKLLAEFIALCILPFAGKHKTAIALSSVVFMHFHTYPIDLCCLSACLWSTGAVDA